MTNFVAEAGIVFMIYPYNWERAYCSLHIHVQFYMDFKNKYINPFTKHSGYSTFVQLYNPSINDKYLFLDISQFNQGP